MTIASFHFRSDIGSSDHHIDQNLRYIGTLEADIGQSATATHFRPDIGSSDHYIDQNLRYIGTLEADIGQSATATHFRLDIGSSDHYIGWNLRYIGTLEADIGQSSIISANKQRPLIFARISAVLIIISAGTLEKSAH